MREIKYMAWDNEDKKMAKVVAIDWDCHNIIVSCHLEYKDGSVKKRYPCVGYGDDIELLEYSGLPDMNGTPIYEGHIVKDEFGVNHAVTVLNGCFTIDDMGILKDFNNNVFITGTVFENPELLEVD